MVDSQRSVLVPQASLWRANSTQYYKESTYQPCARHATTSPPSGWRQEFALRPMVLLPLNCRPSGRTGPLKNPLPCTASSQSVNQFSTNTRHLKATTHLGGSGYGRQRSWYIRKPGPYSPIRPPACHRSDTSTSATRLFERGSQQASCV